MTGQPPESSSQVLSEFLKAVRSRSLLVLGDINVNVNWFQNAETEWNCSVLQFVKMDVDERTHQSSLMCAQLFSHNKVHF